MTVTIIDATRNDLDRLHTLAADALPFDTFSPALLDEKLFFNPFPGRDTYHTLLAEVDGQAVGMLQHVMRPGDQQAWLGLFAVVSSHRRQGIGRRLFETARTAWIEHGIQTVEVLTIPNNYFVAGIDPRYTPAVCFVERLGFERTKETANMRANLDASFDTSADETRLAGEGITIRRARTDDRERFERFFAQYFGEGWLRETELEMQRTPPAVHLALAGDDIIAFAGHSAINREWGHFGPMGTADAARGRGIGRVLLLRCMADLKAAGHATAVIPWIGPHGFYSRMLDCRIERVLWRFKLDLASGMNAGSGGL